MATIEGEGFVQRNEREAKEGTLYHSVEAYLEKEYGKKRPNPTPGLKWLTGLDGYDTHLDHPEYRVKNGLKTLIAKPYGLHLKQIEELVAFAKAKNLNLFIRTPSNYNLSTLLVIFTQHGVTKDI